MIISNHLFLILTGILFILFAVFFFFLIQMFVREKSRRGLVRSWVLVLIFLPAIFFTGLFQMHLALLGLLSIIGISVLLFLIPFKTQTNLTDTLPKQRIDERDIMFSRNELIKGTKQFEDFYQRNPAKLEKDEMFRKEPGLLAEGTKYYHKKIFKSAQLCFEEVDKLHPEVKGLPAPIAIDTDPEKISKSLKKLLSDNGAKSAGICKLEDYHFYSHQGRRSEYGRKILPYHKYAIAFTVEMDFERVQTAPAAPIVLESAKQYLNSGKIAVELAGKIREMGYDARAHIDGNYEVLCPLVGRDAGLGEIGRMGLLMSPELGPRHRIGVVTTDLELITDNYIREDRLIEFCKWCKKCADCCPGNSISKKDPGLINGIKRWQIDQESCYTFWCKAGTDCGRCMSVCPFSHPNYGLHRLVRFGINKSKVFRYLAVYLDDFFYGKKPSPGKIPGELLN